MTFSSSILTTRRSCGCGWLLQQQLFQTNKKIINVQQRVPIIRGFFSTPPVLSEEENQDNKFYTGTVKWYKRDTGWGYITPDAEAAKDLSIAADTSLDIWVHRSGIQSSLDPIKFLRNPFLRKGENVRFQAVPNNTAHNDVQGTTTTTTTTTTKENSVPLKAIKVSFRNGEDIPPLRKPFYATRKNNIESKLGKDVLDIMNNDTLSPEEKAMKTKQAIDGANLELKKAVELIQRVGMDISDFPHMVAATNDGKRYVKFSSKEETKNETTTATSETSSATTDQSF